ncbi:MAG: YdcH family protein [Gammaproteobacteria bacterium]
MFGERHNLPHEFPEHVELINKLKTDNADFASLLEQYEALDAEILEIEEEGTPITDEHAEELKYKRVALKDQLYSLLMENAG